MKPRKLTSIILFISAYSPLFVIFAVKDWDFSRNKFGHPWLTFGIIAASVISVIILLLIFGNLHKGNRCVTIKSISNRSMDLINYTLPYIVSFFGFDLSETADVISLGIFLAILFILTVRSHSIFMNPILSIVGYGLYDITFEYDSRIRTAIVLTNIELQSNQRYYLRPLTPYLQVIKEEDKQE
jgi:hypothetical protein